MAFKLNQTAFNISVGVVYTGSGGGTLTLTDISFREAGTNNTFVSHTSSLSLEDTGQMERYGIIANRLFADIMEVEFSITIQNMQSHGLSTKLIQRLCKYSTWSSL